MQIQIQIIFSLKITMYQHEVDNFAKYFTITTTTAKLEVNDQTIITLTFRHSQTTILH